MKFTTPTMFLLLFFSTVATAQWAKVADRSVPMRDGKPNLAAPPAKTPDGKVDLSGVWQPDGAPLPPGVPSVESITGISPPFTFIDITGGMKPEEVPFRPATAAQFAKNMQSEGKDDPIAHCMPAGVPAIANIPIPYKIIQTPGLILILYEESNVFRQIFMDTRKLVADPQPRWMGYSTAKWEGDTLVVDTVGFTGKSWLDRLGHPHSDAMRLTERFRRPDFGHLEVELTIDDPKAYTRPFKTMQRATLLPGEDLMEYFCAENEKDVQHFK
jgi:hypothetical protein